MGLPHVGEIILVAFDFAPAGWALCNGQLLQISENETLFQLIGTTYGGDGESTFALPDLRGRIAIGTGQGPGLQSYVLADAGGAESITLTENQLPSHNHVVNNALTLTGRARNGPGDQIAPVGNTWAADSTGGAAFSNAAPDTDMNAGAIAVGGSLTANPAGGSQPHGNMQPYLGLNFCISLFGVFPSQG